MNTPNIFSTALKNYELILLHAKYGTALPELLQTLKNHIIQDFYTQFVENKPELTDDQKKVAMFFSEISNNDAARMSLLADMPEPIDPEHIRQTFYMIFFERTKAAVPEYLRKVFFADKKYTAYGNSVEFDAEIDQFVEQLSSQYDYINPEIRDSYKREGFYTSLQESYIRKQADVMEGLLKKSIDEEFIGKFIYVDKMATVLYTFFAEQSLRFAHRPIHEAVFKKHVEVAIQDIFAEYDAGRKKVIREKKIAVENYLNRSFFANHRKRYYGMDQEFDRELTSHAQALSNRYDHISSSTRNKYKTTGFHLNAQKSYIQDYVNNMNNILSQEEDLSNTDIDGFTISEKIHTELYKDYVKKIITDLFVENDANRKKRIDENKKKLQTPKQSVQTYAVGTQRSEEAKKLTPQQEQMIQELEAKMLNRVKIDIQYISRMLKKGGPIHIESLIEDMGQGYSQELLAELVELLREFDVEVITKKDKEIEELLIGNKALEDDAMATKPQLTVEKQLIYPTLEVVKADPAVLTSEKLVQIFKEMGYRFLDEKVFIKESEIYIKNRAIREELLNKLIRLETSRDIMRQQRGAPAGGSKYHRMSLDDNKIKIVRQKETILWFAKFDTYAEKINKYFTGRNKIDFHKQLGPRDPIAEQQKYQPKPVDTEEKKKGQTQRITDFNEGNSSDFPNAC